MILCTRASPILFSIFTSLTTVLAQSLASRVRHEEAKSSRCDEELVLNVDEVLGHLNSFTFVKIRNGHTK